MSQLQLHNMYLHTNRPEKMLTGLIKQFMLIFQHVFRIYSSWVWHCLECFDTIGWTSERASGLQKNWVMRCWSGYLSGSKCKWFEYRSSWCHCDPGISCLTKTWNGLPFWCRIIQVFLEKRPLNERCCRCEFSIMTTIKSFHDINSEKIQMSRYQIHWGIIYHITHSSNHWVTISATSPFINVFTLLATNQCTWLY